MIRMSRLTDYAIVLLRYIARDPGRAYTAPEVTLATGLPRPTVSKILGMLAREGLLHSHRGVRGGYMLASEAGEISVARIIRALEGPISLTVCTTSPDGECEHEPTCPVRGHLQKINVAVRDALENVSLADLVGPATALGVSSGGLQGQGSAPGARR